MSFKKLLVANRGEIACRVMRSARALGYRTVAVYSDADAGSPHVLLADEAVHLGASAAASSYLNIAALLDAARRSGADAVHPGYGFLSERADFAQACADAGLVFIGPPATAIQAMGHKADAKRRMLAAGVPCAPGYLGDDQSDARLTAEAEKLGTPLLVKAVAGGGGRGMRLVHTLDDLPDALAGARREAASAFGDDRLMLERLIEHGRHIEVQVFADRHGNAIHLGERDCTAQRRRQKVVEEAPSPVVDAAMRARLGADAVAAALAVGYVGAGTVEFIVDAQMQHWFLEMNTRLQVEHPVTEAITGLDLVAWQLRIAAGEALPLRQDEVRFSGHAIEVRLYAEDPSQGFTPQTGPVLHWRPAATLRPGVRIDAGILEGGEVGPHYDPMLAKLVAHGHDRTDAIRRLIAALDDTPLLGLRHNAGFLRGLIDSDAFREATLHTRTLDDWATQAHALLAEPAADTATWQLAAALLASGHDGVGALPPAGLRPAGVAGWDMTLRRGDERRLLRVQPGPQCTLVSAAGEPDGTVQLLHWQDHVLRWCCDGVTRQAAALRRGRRLHLAIGALSFCFDEPSPWPDQTSAADPGRLVSPVAGTVAAIKVAVGDAVAAGQPLLCVEAMKMEMWLPAARAGRVLAVHAQLRDSVAAGALLIELDLLEEQEPA